MDDLIERLRANALDECDEAIIYIEALERQVKAADALADLLDEAVYILGQHRVTAPVVVEGRQAVTAHRVAKKGGA